MRVHRARRGISPPFFAQHPFALAIQQRRVQAMRSRRPIQLWRNAMTRRLLKCQCFVDLVGLWCAPRDCSAIFETKPISLGIRTEEGLHQASTEAYCLMLQHNDTTSSQKSIFCPLCRVIVRAAGFLRHFWYKPHFLWHSDRGGSRLYARADILTQF